MGQESAFKEGLTEVAYMEEKLSYLNAFLVVDSANHLYTHFCNFGKCGLFDADIPKNLYHSLSDTNTSILQGGERKLM